MKITSQNIFLCVLVCLCFIVVSLLYDPSTTLAQSVPEGFQVQEIVSDLIYPTALAFTPDGRMFIALKNGTVRVVKEGDLLDEPLVVLSDVNNYYERGLLGVAVDPDFLENGYVYLLYTYENSPGQHYDGPKTGRLVRVRVIGDKAEESTKEVLLGSVGGSAENPSCSDFDITADCIRSDSSSHSVGGLRFGPDGKLYVSLGDGANFDHADPNALSSLELDALSGKILRINTDGTGPSDNPFYDGNPDSNRSKVWSYGLRNPYRFNFQPVTGELFIADVGWGAAEEVNIDSRGANYGWPCREGYGQTSYNCTTEDYTDPLYTYPHSEEGIGSITGGSFPAQGAYPDEYMNSYFFGDYSIGFIKEMKLDESNNILSVNSFVEDAGGPVEILTGPDGTIYYIDIIAGALRNIVYSDENQAPRAYADATPTSGDSPLLVNFSSNGSFDPDGDPVTFLWNFDDGSGTSTLQNPAYSFGSDGVYNVSLTVRDSSGLEDTAGVIVRVGQEQQTYVDPFHVSTSTSPDINYIGREVLITTTVGNDGLEEEPFIVDIEMYNSQNEKVGQRVYEEITIPSGVTHEYSYTWFPPKVGEYRVAVGIFKTQWSGLHEWVNDAASVSVVNRVPDNEAFAPSHISTTVVPEIVSEGETTLITTRVHNSGGAGSMLVDIEVIKDGNKVGQLFFDNELFEEGETREFRFDWEALEPGSYSISVGLFSAGWTELYSWNSAVSEIIVEGEDYLRMYDDSLGAGWSNWSWESRVDFNTSEHVFSGSSAIRVDFDSAWAGLYLHSDAVSTVGKDTLAFALSGGSTGGQSLKVFLYDKTGSPLFAELISTYTNEASLPQEAWRVVSIPLANLQGTDRTITGFALQGTNGVIQDIFYVDDITIK